MRYDFLNLISMFSFQLASLIKHKNSDSEEEEEEDAGEEDEEKNVEGM